MTVHLHMIFRGSYALFFFNAFSLTTIFGMECPDITFEISSPMENVVYLNTPITPQGSIRINEGVVANDIRSRPHAYEVCYQIDIDKSFRCFSLLDSIQFSPHLVPEGHHKFKIYLKLKDHELRGNFQFENIFKKCYYEISYSTGKKQIEKNRLENGKTVSLFHGHDSHVAISSQGHIEFILEFERLLNIRYFDACHLHITNSNQSLNERSNEIKNAWIKTSREIFEKAQVNSFSLGIFQNIDADISMQNNFAILTAMKYLKANQWIAVSHHQSHATLSFWDAYFSSNIKKPLILSFDGGGNDGTTVILKGDVYANENDQSVDDNYSFQAVQARNLSQLYMPFTDPFPLNHTLSQRASMGVDVHGNQAMIHHAEHELKMDYLNRVKTYDDTNTGMAYEGVAAVLPEVAKSLVGTCLADMGLRGLALAGKMMGYSALGQVRAEYIKVLTHHFLSHHQYPEYCVFDVKQLPNTELKEIKPNFFIPALRKDQRDLAATTQYVMEEFVVDLIKEGIKQEKIRKYRTQMSQGQQIDLLALAISDPDKVLDNMDDDIDGIIITGGCALNVLANSRVSREWPNKQVYISAAPSDCGLAVGSTWIVQPPNHPFDQLPAITTASSSTSMMAMKLQDEKKQSPIQLQYMGFPIWDLSSLDMVGRQLGARKLNFESLDENQDMKYLAKLFNDDQIIGVVRGNSEHGPRALGHRSLLAKPSAGMKERLNALKYREWYRPVAPMLIEEDADRMFERDSPNRPISSPFMSFAPKMKPEAVMALPAVGHYDQTARPQTVSNNAQSPGYEPWLHCLLSEVKSFTQWGVLINTSFNSRGRPILNSLKEALELLKEVEELDYILVGDWLFSKMEAQKA